MIRFGKSLYPMMLVAVAIVACATTFTTATMNVELFDLQPNWFFRKSGTGLAASLIRLEASAGALQFRVSQYAKSNGNLPGGRFELLAKTTCTVQGDFLVNVDVHARAINTYSGIRNSLGIERTDTGLELAHIERASYSTKDQNLNAAFKPGDHVTSNIAGRLNTIPTTSVSGRLQLQRSGSTISAWYRDNVERRLVGSFNPGYSGPVRLFIGVHSRDSVFDHINEQAEFDNLFIDYSTCR